MKRNNNYIVILITLLFTTCHLMAQITTKEFKRVAIQQTIQYKNDLYVLKMNMTVPKFSQPLQSYLSSIIFPKGDSVLLSAINGFITEHQPNEDIPISSVKDTLIYELNCMSYVPSKYISIYIRYPQFDFIKDTNEKVYKIIDRQSSFIFDLRNGQVLTFNEIFSFKYLDPLEKFDENGITDYLFNYNYSYELDDDFLSYGDKTFVRLPLVQAKDYFTQEFRELVDWNVIEHRADSLGLRGSEVKDIQEKEVLRIKNYQKRLDNIESDELKREYLAYCNDDDPNYVIHLYMKGKECWVSGLNKDIFQLSEMDMLQLGKKSKDILKDIEIMKKWMKQQNGIAQDERIYTKPDQQKVFKNLTTIHNYVEKHISNKFNMLKAHIAFVIDEDGHIVSPVIIKGDNIDVNKQFISLLRKYKKCDVFHVGGKPVKMRVNTLFSFEWVKNSF